MTSCQEHERNRLYLLSPKGHPTHYPALKGRQGTALATAEALLCTLIWRKERLHLSSFRAKQASAKHCMKPKRTEVTCTQHAPTFSSQSLTGSLCLLPQSSPEHLCNIFITAWLFPGNSNILRSKVMHQTGQEGNHKAASTQMHFRGHRL